MGKKKRISTKLERVEGLVAPKAKLVKKSVCTCSFLLSAAKTVCLILFYYFFSISLTFYNQRFIHQFKFPLSITMVHLVTKFVLAGLVRLCLQCKTGTSRIVLSWRDYIFKVAPPGITSSLDIALSNWSFEFITVSLYTMTKSTVIVFILGFSLLFKLEKMKCSLIFVVLFIAIGLFLFTYQSTQFHMTGFLLVLSASFLSGLRWTLAQLVLQKKEIGLRNPIDMMYHIQPWMILALLPLSAGFEGTTLSSTKQGFAFENPLAAAQTLGLSLVGAVLAFMMEAAEFLLVLHTSGLTMAISSIIKEICTLYLATQINGDRMNFINEVGLVVCLFGITLHVIMKAVHNNEEVNTQIKDGAMEMLLTRRGDINNSDEDDEVDLFNVQRDR